MELDLTERVDLHVARLRKRGDRRNNLIEISSFGGASAESGAEFVRMFSSRSVAACSREIKQSKRLITVPCDADTISVAAAEVTLRHRVTGVSCSTKPFHC